MVDVLHNHLDNNVDSDTAENIADKLVEIYPSFESLFDHTNGLHQRWNDDCAHILEGHGIAFLDRTMFLTMLGKEAIRRGLEPPPGIRKP